MKRIDLKSLATYRDAGPSKIPVHEDQYARVLFLCFKAGQEVQPCVMERDVIFVVIEGHGVLTAEREDAVLEPGTMVIVPRGVERAIRARTDLSVLGVQTG